MEMVRTQIIKSATDLLESKLQENPESRDEAFEHRFHLTREAVDILHRGDLRQVAIDALAQWGQFHREASKGTCDQKSIQEHDRHANVFFRLSHSAAEALSGL